MKNEQGTTVLSAGTEVIGESENDTFFDAHRRFF
jgi:hypothetical protein